MTPRDLLVRMDDARSVEVLAYLAQHVTGRIERAQDESVRIGRGVLALDAQFSAAHICLFDYKLLSRLSDIRSNLAPINRSNK
jgi:hypothetical protein